MTHSDSPHQPEPSALMTGHDLTIGYRDHPVSQGLDVAIPRGGFTAIIGPNGCGKSTLLRTLCRLIEPGAGEVLLDGKTLASFAGRELAKRIGLLSQTAIAPEGIRVRDLVARGRYPHQNWLQQWSLQDEQAVASAMRMTGIESLAARGVDQLSGGQRQRVWIAMVLAQETPLILLDEPTTYLDITHQIELLELFHALNQQTGRTLVAVLHDINQACRYASHLIAMRDGRIVATGAPGKIVTATLMRDVFDLACDVMEDPVTGTPLIVPHRVSVTIS